MKLLPLLLLLLLVACDVRRKEPEMPLGFTLSGDADLYTQWLKQAAAWSGTPLAAFAKEELKAVAGCKHVLRQGTVEPARCTDKKGELRLSFKGETGVTFTAMPWRDGATWHIEELVRAVPADAPWNVLLSSNTAPLASVLHHEGAVLHALMHADRPLDLMSLIPEGSGAQTLLRLKSRLFSAAVLDGAWEVAVHGPTQGAQMPAMAVALGIRSDVTARAALDELVADLERTWGLRATPLQSVDGQGACFTAVPLLPEFAPCWLLMPKRLVIAWNQATLKRLLRNATILERGLVVDFEQMALADQALSQARGQPAPRVPYPWKRLHLNTSGNSPNYAVSIQLEAVAP